MIPNRKLLSVAVALAFAAPAVPAFADTSTGPSSSASPFVVNVPARVDIMSLLTVGDSVNTKPGSSSEPYRMVGIPDGMGAYDNGDGTFTVLMDHELNDNVGVVREHGAIGSFVSQWIIRKSDLAVLHGGDLIKKQFLWNSSTGVYEAGVDAISRLCSADLPLASAFYNAKSGKGYSGRIFMNGEETGAEGRAFAHIATGPGAGISYQLPYLGRFSWENSLASPYQQDKTIVIGLDDTTPGQLYVYVGEKQDTGNEVDKAGLSNGTLSGIKVEGVGNEDRLLGIPNGTPFSLYNFGDVSGLSGAELQNLSGNDGENVTQFLRPEDGAWDPTNPNVFYFVTTDRFDTTKDGSGGTTQARSRLYRLTFRDIRHPDWGGKIDTMLDGTGPQQMLDNIAVDADGNLLMQEDPGGNNHLARVWKFYPKKRKLVEIAKSDPARFGVPATPAFLTVDEEHSGIIEVTDLLGKELASDRKKSERDDDDGKRSRAQDDDDDYSRGKGGNRYYLGVTQVHSSSSVDNDAELVEGGQLWLLTVPENLK